MDAALAALRLTGATFCVLELDSSDHLPGRASKRPHEPVTVLGDVAAVSRVREAGLRGLAADGAAVLRRMDAEGITGSIRIAYGLSDTENAATQGPVWRLAGRSV